MLRVPFSGEYPLQTSPQYPTSSPFIALALLHPQEGRHIQQVPYCAYLDAPTARLCSCLVGCLVACVVSCLVGCLRKYGVSCLLGHIVACTYLTISCTCDNLAAACVWHHAGLEHIIAVPTAETEPGGACVSTDTCSTCLNTNHSLNFACACVRCVATSAIACCWHPALQVTASSIITCNAHDSMNV
jgi:hypothetical protein